MNWSSLAEFLAMGGYGLYVWGSFVMVAGALLWEAVLLAARRRRALELARERFQDDPGVRDVAS